MTSVRIENLKQYTLKKHIENRKYIRKQINCNSIKKSTK